MLSNWQADDEEEDADGPVGTKLLQIPEWLMVRTAICPACSVQRLDRPSAHALSCCVAARWYYAATC